MKNKKIVVTGAAGFIGSGVVRYFNDLGRTNLIIVDNLDHPDKVKNLQGKKYEQLLSISV
jgi:ADP-L-glycero-D-manno-heptose 6-epimerase